MASTLPSLEVMVPRTAGIEIVVSCWAWARVRYFDQSRPCSCTSRPAKSVSHEDDAHERDVQPPGRAAAAQDWPQRRMRRPPAAPGRRAGCRAGAWPAARPPGPAPLPVARHRCAARRHYRGFGRPAARRRAPGAGAAVAGPLSTGSLSTGSPGTGLPGTGPLSTRCPPGAIRALVTLARAPARALSRRPAGAPRAPGCSRPAPWPRPRAVVAAVASRHGAYPGTWVSPAGWRAAGRYGRSAG